MQLYGNDRNRGDFFSSNGPTKFKVALLSVYYLQQPLLSSVLEFYLVINFTADARLSSEKPELGKFKIFKSMIDFDLVNLQINLIFIRYPVKCRK